MEPAGITLKEGNNVTTLASAASNGKALQSWQGLITLLQESSTLLKNKQVAIVLSNHYVRYSLIAWRENVFKAEDWQALSKAHLRTIYGPISEGWQVDVQSQGYEAPSLVNAVDKTLLQQLETVVKQAGGQLEAVEPALSYITDLHGGDLKDNDAILLSEPGQILLAIKQAGIWQQIELCAPVEERHQQEADNLLRRLVNTSKTLPQKLHVFGLSKQNLSDWSQKMPVSELGHMKSATLAKAILESV